ncbi:MAG: asparagine synthase-related protein [Trueperaceae bacterium]|nr:asparagine synthase-related protein [Trueperaceae bacterium]
MCGICGVHGPHPDPERVTAGMMEDLRHRGPDGSGMVRRGPTTLGHVRLAIVDPEGGDQPLLSEDGRVALAGNAEIYQHARLRRALRGHRFATDSDCEAALHLFEEEGPGFARGLDGMYALAIADGRDLVLARDPLGIKPLYVAHDGDTTFFASEITPLARLGLPVRPLAPGTAWHTRRGTIRTYELPGARPELRDADEAAGAVRAALEAAVDKRLMADVPLGAFLSGGLDSSAIAALAIRRTGRLRTFSVGVAGSPDLVAARRVAEHLGTDHVEGILEPEEVREVLPRIVPALESFDADLVRSVVPTWFTARLAARYVKVILTGEGADEAFAGYAYHRDYRARPDALATELTRSLGSMHDVNLQRVDRMTMTHGLEGRVPFLDRDVIDVAQRIDPRLKQRDGVEKWILRKAVQNLLPREIVWRDKAQFDEGSGTKDLLGDIARTLPGTTGDAPVPLRSAEEAAYWRMFEASVPDAWRVAGQVGRWEADRT